MKFQEIWKTQTFIAVIDSIVCCFSVELKKTHHPTFYWGKPRHINCSEENDERSFIGGFLKFRYVFKF